MISAIHHIALATPDIDRAASEYTRLFNRPPDGAIAGRGARQVWFSTSNIRFALVAPDGAGDMGDRVRARLAEAGEGLWSIRFCVDQLEKAAQLFERRGLAPGAEYALPVEAGGAAAELRAQDLHGAADLGVATTLVAAQRPAPLAASAAGVGGLDHVVIRTADPE
ncbi:MAG: VOC family protein, partial [Rhodoblastus sp.]